MVRRERIRGKGYRVATNTAQGGSLLATERRRFFPDAFRNRRRCRSKGPPHPCSNACVLPTIANQERMTWLVKHVGDYEFPILGVNQIELRWIRSRCATLPGTVHEPDGGAEGPLWSKASSAWSDVLGWTAARLLSRATKAKADVALRQVLADRRWSTMGKARREAATHASAERLCRGSRPADLQRANGQTTPAPRD